MSHSHSSPNHGKAFAIGITLNAIYAAVELFYGFAIDSTALKADAGHNATDILSLILAWGAFKMAAKKPSGNYTYGMRRTTILASIVNGILIVGAAVLIALEAIRSFQDPPELPGNVLMIVAAVGLVVNTATAFLFYKDQKKDLNIKGAFLHMLADAAVTLGVLIGGLVIKYTGINWIDPVLGLIIVLVILYSAWGLLRDSTALVLDAVPKNVPLEKVREFLENYEGVAEVHDLHIWAMSTSQTALTAHLVMPDGHTDETLYKIRDQLHERFEISHTTLQVEKEFEDEEYRPYRS